MPSFAPHSHVGDVPFAVILGDDVMFCSVPGIQQLINVAQAEKMPVVGVMEAPQKEVNKYAIIDGEEISPGGYRVRGMVEKPTVVGRYALFSDIFDYLDKVEPGHGGGIQLTDVLKILSNLNRVPCKTFIFPTHLSCPSSPALVPSRAGSRQWRRLRP